MIVDKDLILRAVADAMGKRKTKIDTDLALAIADEIIKVFEAVEG
jgi:hypothetical protein